MPTYLKRLPRSMVVGLSGLIITAILAASFALLVYPRINPHIALASASVTCATAPSQQHCDNQDPEIQGCAETNAETIAKADIIQAGQIIGRVERRFSTLCTSWWGRVFDFRAQSQANMFVGIGGTTTSASPTFVSPSYRILYSPMVFETSAYQTVPEITGSLSIDAATPPAVATVPAIVIPKQS